MKKLALVWLPFNDPSMPPLGVADLVGHLRTAGFQVDPFDLNIDIFNNIQSFFSSSSKNEKSIYQDWSYNSINQNMAASLAFSEFIPEPPHSKPVDLSILSILKNCFYTFAETTLKKYDIIGISVTNVSLLSAIALSKIVKEIATHIKIIWGGPSVNYANSFEQLDQLSCVDLFVEGAGEIILEEILKHPSGESKFTNRWIRQDIALDCKNDTYGIFSDFSSFPLKKYYNLSFPVQTASGCQWSRCSFCVEPYITKKFFPKPVDAVKKQIRQLHNKYLATSLYFIDNSLNSSTKRLLEICRSFPKDVVISWTCMARSDKLNSRLLKAMKNAGCRKVFIGLESLSNRTLKAMEKGCTVLDHLRAFRLSQEINIPLQGNFMIGFPTETDEDILESIAIIKRYTHLWKNCSFGISPFIVTPGSKIFNSPEKYNINVHDTGSEADNLPNQIKNLIPAWSHHWSLVNCKETSILKRCRLNHELITLVHFIQTCDLPCKYYTEDKNGIYIYSETDNRENLIKVHLKNLEANIIRYCRNVITIKKLLLLLKIEYALLLQKIVNFEKKGWLVMHDDKIVLTIPLLQ